MLPITATIFDGTGFYEAIAKLASAVALWASMKADRPKPTGEEYVQQEITMRLRHPWKYRIQKVTRLFQ